VKPGYKKTEVGVIPLEWETKACSEVSERIMVGIVIRPTQYYVNNGVPAFRSANIREDGINDLDLVFISEESNAVLVKSQTRTGDVLTVRTGYPGTSAVVHSRHEGCNCIDILITRPSKKLDSEWLAIWINSPFGKEQVLRNQGGLAQKHFNVGDMRNLIVALPPLPEQHAIAEVLFDVDGLLGELDHLITKKRDIKHATMQQLLTGQTRLPGFGPTASFKKYSFGSIPDDWDVKPLKSVSTMNGRIGWQGLKQEEFTLSPNDPFLITGMNFKDGKIRWDEVYHIPEKRYVEAAPIQLQPNDVLMTKDGTIGKLLYVEYIPHPGRASLNSHLLVFRPIAGQYNPKFLFYQLSSPTFSQHIELHKSGTTFFGLSQTATGKYPTILPSVPEQTAIAEVLTEMDAELVVLEQRREKTRALKQAMMQELLTGRTRLL